MTRSVGIRLAVGAAVALIVGMTLAGIAFIAAIPRDLLPVGFRLEEFVAYTLIQISFGAMATLLALRRPRNPIGWLFFAIAILSAWLQVSSGYALKAIVEGRSEGPLIAWIYNMSAGLLIAPLIPAIVVFPDGRPSTRSGRILLWLSPVNVVAVAFLAILPGPLLNMPSVRNPFPLVAEGPGLVALAVLFVGAFLLLPALFVHDLVTRVRTASGVLRQQLKWLVWNGVLILVTVVLAGVLAVLTAGLPAGGSITYAARMLYALAVSTLPIALGLAIVRYRLYDIDLVIRRTLVYATLSAFIGFSYLALVVLFQTALRPLTSGSEIAVAASTLATLALIQPVKSRVQNVVDRRFFRARYDASRTIDAFSSRLRNEVEIETVRGDLLDVVARSVEPAHAQVWLRQIPVTISGRAMNRKDTR